MAVCACHSTVVALVVFEVIVHAHLVAVVVDADIELSAVGVEQTGYAAEDVLLLLFGSLAHDFAGSCGRIHE